MNKINKQVSVGKIVIYKKGIEVQLREESLWLNQSQIAELFGIKRPAITKHLSNIFKSKELKKSAVCSKMEHTAADGKVYKTNFYNLDVIISVGYRVNSSQATQFRIWATNVLRKHLVDGYTINEKRLKKQEQKYLELKKAVSLIENVAQIKNLSSETKGLAQVISEYARALDILDDFDHERLNVPKGRKQSKYIMTYEQARTVIRAMKEKFDDSKLVGQEKDDSFKGSLGAIYQSVRGQDAYPTIEEKAAHLLYFVTKNHSFVDGNKRIAASLFVCFLEKNNILCRKDGSRVIDNNALVALTLMIAASHPKEKDIMVKVILNLIS